MDRTKKTDKQTDDRWTDKCNGQTLATNKVALDRKKER